MRSNASLPLLVAVAVLLAQCSHPGDLTPAGLPGRAAPAEPQYARPAGTASLRLSVTSDEGGKLRRLDVDFAVRTAAPGTAETVEILSAGIGPPGGELRALDLSPACRREFGATESRLGVFELTQGEDLSRLIPLDAPEPLFGAATDLYAFLQVQDAAAEHGGRLVRPGDHVDLPGFAARWSRPPGALDTRIVADRVRLTLTDLTAGRAVLRWEPLPMRFHMVRSGPREGTRLLLDGVETVVLEVEVDPRTGRLLAGRSLVDEVKATVVFPWDAASVPAPGGSAPAPGGFPANVSRQLVLESRT